MPGPPLSDNSENFQPIVIFLHGNGGDGKSTTSVAITKDTSHKLIQLDEWCYLCLNPNMDTKFSLSETLGKNDKNIVAKLKSYFESKMKDLDKSHNIYFFEGYVLKINELKNVIKTSIKTNYFWNMSRDK